MKKTMFILFFVLTTMLLFAGGQQGSDQEGTGTSELIFADWLSAQDAFRPHMEAGLAKYEALHPEIKLTHLSWEFGQYINQILVLASSGDAPDVALLPFETVPVFAEKNILATIDEWYTEEKQTNFYPAGLKSSIYKDHYVGVPFYASGIGLLRNTKLFAQAGLDPSKGPADWDEYLTAARSVSALGPDIYGTDARYAGGAMITYLWPWFVQGGGSMTDANGKITVDSKETIATVKFLADMYKEGLNVPGGAEQREMNEQFALGKLAFLQQGPWIYKVLAVTDPDFADFDISVMPEGPVKRGTGYHGGNLVVFNQTKNKEGALGILDFWATEGQDSVWAAQNAVGTKDAWTKQAKINPFAGKEGFLPNWTATYKDLVETADFDPMIFLPEAAKITEIFVAEVTMAMLQEKTAEQAMKDAARQMRALTGQ